MTDNTPSAILQSNEEYVNLLANKASAEVLTQYLKQYTPGDLELRYMFLAQMVAVQTTPTQRAEWNTQFINMMADHFLDGPEEGTVGKSTFG
jgi:hypothetical protein